MLPLLSRLHRLHPGDADGGAGRRGPGRPVVSRGRAGLPADVVGSLALGDTAPAGWPHPLLPAGRRRAGPGRRHRRRAPLPSRPARGPHAGLRGRERARHGADHRPPRRSGGSRGAGRHARAGGGGAEQPARTALHPLGALRRGGGGPGSRGRPGRDDLGLRRPRTPGSPLPLGRTHAGRRRRRHHRRPRRLARPLRPRPALPPARPQGQLRRSRRGLGGATGCAPPGRPRLQLLGPERLPVRPRALRGGRRARVRRALAGEMRVLSPCTSPRGPPRAASPTARSTPTPRLPGRAACACFSHYDDDFAVILDDRPWDAGALRRAANSCQGRVVVVRPVRTM